MYLYESMSFGHNKIFIYPEEKKKLDEEGKGGDL